MVDANADLRVLDLPALRTLVEEVRGQIETVRQENAILKGEIRRVRHETYVQNAVFLSADGESRAAGKLNARRRVELANDETSGRMTTVAEKLRERSQEAHNLNTRNHKGEWENCEMPTCIADRAAVRAFEA
jgi:hypothetical protein